jgi:Ni/Co efflux regulator RcnB
MGVLMTKRILTAILAAALMAAPVPTFTHGAQAQTEAKPAKKTKAKKPPTAGQLAARERQKKCGAEWKAAKKAGKVEKGMTWPKYWSACNKRLRAAGK